MGQQEPDASVGFMEEEKLILSLRMVSLAVALEGFAVRHFIVASLVLCCGCSQKEAKPPKPVVDVSQETSEIKSLTAKQAAELVANTEKGHGLFLSSLISIDKDVAKQLAEVEGDLSLKGLTSIDKDVAKELAKSKSRGLNLKGLISIDKDVMKELAEFKGPRMIFGLNTIDKDTAKELAKYGGALSFHIHSIDKDVAQELAKKMEGELRLGLITSIDKSTAQNLARFKNSLSLNGLTSIDKDIAQELAKSHGSLGLDGLTSIDEDVARELAKFEGKSLLLRSWEKLEEEVREILSKNESINFLDQPSRRFRRNFFSY
ncbi:hypothetical protein N8Z04_01345 [bacterium]|nr:hypothetical protein [bacterium]